jgi:hypothetical protein
MLITAQILLSKLNILLYDNIQTHSNKQKQLFNITHRSTTSTLQHIWTWVIRGQLLLCFVSEQYKTTSEESGHKQSHYIYSHEWTLQHCRVLSPPTYTTFCVSILVIYKRMKGYILNIKTLSQSMNKYKGAPIYIKK